MTIRALFMTALRYQLLFLMLQRQLVEGFEKKSNLAAPPNIDHELPDQAAV